MDGSITYMKKENPNWKKAKYASNVKKATELGFKSKKRGKKRPA
jgi:hypothetical protein